MKRERKLISTLTIAIIVLAIGLAGCDSSAQNATGAATQQVASTATVPAIATAPGVSDQTTSTPEVAGSAAPATIAVGIVGTSTVSPAATAQVAACAKLNLNDTNESALMATIPGFSSRMVREFTEYKPYASIQQFRREIGKYIDASQVAEYEKYVYVPVDANNSDAETLKQLPGVDDALAGDLMNGRPYASNEAFLQALATRATAQQLTEATCYLVTNP